MNILTNYIKISFRQITRHKLFTVINVLGLAMSMSIGMLIIAMIFSLLKFDRFHENKDRIFRVVSKVNEINRPEDEKAVAPLPLAERLQALSSVEKTVRIRKRLNDFVIQGNNEILLDGYYTEPSFLQTFSFQLLDGDLETSLREPFSIVLTQHGALKLFNSENVIGKTITFKQLGTYKITGLLTDVPPHSHMSFEALASFSSVPILEKQIDEAGDPVVYPVSEHWDRLHSSYVYILLKPDASVEHVNEFMQAVGKEVYGNNDNFKADFYLQNLLNIVPGPGLSAQIGTKMIYLALFIFIGFALLILIAASFNYTNLSIARAFQRAKEVGLRKISGAARKQIIGQFLLESVFTALIALVIAISIYNIIAPHVMQNIPRATELFDLQLRKELIVAFIGFALFTGFCAGILPSLVLSRVNVVESLKQIKNLNLVGRVGVRNGLVIFQFTLSLFLFTALTIMYRQYQYSLNKDLGFDKDNTFVVNLSGTNPGPLINSLKQFTGIQSVFLSSNIPGTTSVNQELVRYKEGEDSLYVATISAEPSFISELNFMFLAGNNFPDTVVNKNIVIINERFLNLLQAENPIDALGKTFDVEGQSKQVIGVVKDFHYTQLENAIEPFFFQYDPDKFRYANLKCNGANLFQLKSSVEETWNKLNPETPFRAAFLDEHIEETYQFYVRLMRVFGFIGITAMAIAVLGLLGMASYNTERRTKEIGIRKVLGARIFQIVILLSRGFAFLLVAAAFIALPTAYLLFDMVILNLGVYRISIGVLEMSFGFLILLTVGFGVIFSQTIIVSLANPVNALRRE